MSAQAGGIFGGLDIPLEPNIRIGFAAGWSRTDMDAGARFSSADGDAWHVATWAAGGFGDWRLRGIAAYDDYAIDTTRTAVIGTNLATATASYGARRIEALAEVGHVLHLKGGTLEPYAGAGLS